MQIFLLTQNTELYLARGTTNKNSLLKAFIEVIWMLAGNNVYQFSETNFGYQTVVAWLKTFYEIAFIVKDNINNLKRHLYPIFLNKG